MPGACTTVTPRISTQMLVPSPVTMIKMFYDRAKDPLRAFSDAFRIRKEG